MMAHENVAVNFYQQPWQILTDFHEFCTFTVRNEVVTKFSFLWNANVIDLWLFVGEN